MKKLIIVTIPFNLHDEYNIKKKQLQMTKKCVILD